MTAANADGVWNEQGAALRFTKRAHVYQTWWFLGVCVAAAAGLTAGGYRWRVLRYARRERDLARRVQEAIEQIQTLRGLLPICAWCKKVRDDRGYWEQIEVYVRDHSSATFTHGICPECATRFDEGSGGRR